MNYHRGLYVQRGRGLGNIFSSIFRAVAPTLAGIGKSIIKSPITKNLLSTAKKSAVNAGLNLVSDTLAGENVGRSLKRSANRARVDFIDVIESGRNKKKRSKITPKTRRNVGFTRSRRNKKIKHRDIFDE